MLPPDQDEYPSVMDLVHRIEADLAERSQHGQVRYAFQYFPKSAWVMYESHGVLARSKYFLRRYEGGRMQSVALFTFCDRDTLVIDRSSPAYTEVVPWKHAHLWVRKMIMS